MENLDINTFTSFKTNINTQEFNNNIFKKLNVLFPDSDKNKKNNKNKINNNNNILKNQKIQSQKDNICNKVNLILNKLSEKNINNLIIKFIENINQVSPEIFKDIQKTFYLKIISEINFINIYIEFIIIIGFLYNKVQKYNLSYFYNMVETKFKLDYTNYEINPINNLSFIIDLNGETNRINNLIIINNMIKYKLISNDIFNICDEIILNQKIFFSDIYYWFNYQNRKLNTSEIIKINDILNNNNIPNRDLILLKNMLQENGNNIQIKEQHESKDNIHIKTPYIKSVSNNQKINQNNNQINTINLECIHIIDEYLLLKSIDDLKYFIDTRCIDTITKNKFCENLINKYFLSNKETSDEIIHLIKQLVKLSILFKSNFSRGLLLIYNNWDELSIDYNNPIPKIKLLLSILKSIGITKGLEELLEKYRK